MATDRRLLLFALAAGTALRIAQTVTSLGSLDAMLWYRFAGILERVGVLASYRETTLMNHPPLVLLIASVVNRAGSSLGLEFQDSFRFLQIAADLATALVLVRIVRRVNVPHAPLLFFLSPAAVFVSAFHCNSDPLMMMFVAIAVAAAMEERAEVAGIALACAVGIKIVPLFVGPLFLFALRRSRWRFLASAAATFAIIFLPALIANGATFLRQVFGYTGLVRSAWGLPLLAHLLEVKSGMTVPLSWLPPALVAVLALSWWCVPASSRSLPALVATSLLLVLVLAPGFGVQYLYWPLPFVAFALPWRSAVAFHAAVSAYLFATYTVWCGGWPWRFADQAGSPRASAGLTQAGLALWLFITAAAIAAVVRAMRTSRKQESGGLAPAA